MTKSSLVADTIQIMTIQQDLIRIMPRLRAILPENLARLKENLEALHPASGSRRTVGYAGLFYQVCVILSRQQDPLTMGELSEMLAVPLSTATRLVDWLVESSYAERLSDLEDRRIVRVRLTPTGRDLYQAINEFLKQRVEQVLGRFTDEERKNLIVLLRKLVDALGQMEE